jgi:hypothetical protein
MPIPEMLADCCRNYFRTIMTMNDPPRPSSREAYKQLLRDGYLSHAPYYGRQARQSINMASGASWGALDRAATDFAGNLGNGLGALGESGRLGARDFLGLCWLTGDFDRNALDPALDTCPDAVFRQ